MWTWLSARTLMLALIVLTVRTVEEPKCSDHRNAMFPEDPFGFYGENFSLCCNVTGAQREVTHPGDVIFKRITEPITSGILSWMTPDRTAVCRDFKLEDEEEEEKKTHLLIKKGVFFYCYRKAEASGVDEECLGYQSVQSDRSLRQELSNVSVDCVTQGGRLRCEFEDISARYKKHPGRVRTTVLVFAHDRQVEFFGKPCDGQRCVCSLRQGVHYQLNDSFLLKLCVTWEYLYRDHYKQHDIRRSEQLNKTVCPRRLVKVLAPRSLRVDRTGSWCVNLSWEQPGSSSTMYVNTLMVRPAERGSVAVKKEEWPSRNASREVCGLSSFTAYTASLRSRANYSDVWSDVTTTTFNTSMAPPDSAPILAPGYLLEPNQQVTLYWQPTGESNAPSMWYVINISGQTEKGDDWSTTLTRHTTHLTLSLPQYAQQKTGSYQVRAQSENEAGQSDNVSRLALLPQTVGPVDVQAIIENWTEDEMTLNITWISVPSRDYSYGVHWCLHSSISARVCKTELLWKVLPPNSTWYSLQMRREWLGQIVYGVSLVQATAQPVAVSGFRFSSCVHQRQNDGTLVIFVAKGCKMDDKEVQMDVILLIIVIGCLFLTGFCFCFSIKKLQNKYVKRKRRFLPKLPSLQILQREREDLLPDPQLLLIDEEPSWTGEGPSGGQYPAGPQEGMRGRESESSHSNGYDSPPTAPPHDTTHPCAYPDPNTPSTDSRRTAAAPSQYVAQSGPSADSGGYADPHLESVSGSYSDLDLESDVNICTGSINEFVSGHRMHEERSAVFSTEFFASAKVDPKLDSRTPLHATGYIHYGHLPLDSVSTEIVTDTQCASACASASASWSDNGSDVAGYAGYNNAEGFDRYLQPADAFRDSDTDTAASQPCPSSQSHLCQSDEPPQELRQDSRLLPRSKSNTAYVSAPP